MDSRSKPRQPRLSSTGQHERSRPGFCETGLRVAHQLAMLMARLGGAPVQLPRLRRRASPPHAQHVVDSDTQCLPPSSYVLRSTFPLCDFCRGASRSSSWLAGHCHSRYNHRPPASCGRSIEFYRLAGFRQTANRVPTNG
jgi:hypothetical protein